MAKVAVAATTGTVYLLKDPRTRKGRYVGATTSPLASRLAGHFSSPTSESMRVWLAELTAANLQPLITPLHEHVPVGELAAVETAEIHVRVLRGEPLLNSTGTSAATKILAERAAERSRRQALAMWRVIADHARAVTGGPMPPGFNAAVQLSDDTWAAVLHHVAIARAMQEADAKPPVPLHEIEDPDNYLSEGARLLGEYGTSSTRADQLLQRDAYGPLRLGELWGTWETQVGACIRATASRQGLDDRTAAGRYLALIRWYLTVIPPWRQLAQRCGIPDTGPAFHEWVTENSTVRDALRAVEHGEPFTGRAADEIGAARGSSPPALVDVLVALLTAYGHRRRRQGDGTAIRSSLLYLARHGVLDKRLAGKLLTVDPDALHHVYGPDLAARIAADLEMPADAAGAVIRRLAALLPENTEVRSAAARSTQQLPTAALPDITADSIAAPGLRAIIATFVTAGLIKAPEAAATAYVDRVQRSWIPQLGR
ncbi:hypothetical protein AB0H83_29615 [Dactylosporangium sp. NPDC050688]|uniref:hypothetical protein n=1 Tax=Dactylosporangium sp. NPDC050688 TaxID=3157217 RepID=UPI0033DBB81C